MTWRCEMQTRKALKSFSKGNIKYDRVSPGGPLAQNADRLMKQHEERQASIRQQGERHNIAANLPLLEAARQKIQHIIGERVLPDDTPIAMRFDVFNSIKHVAKGNPRDIGLSRFATHLERLWHEDPVGVLSAGAISRLRDHYQSENPRSIVGDVTDQVVPKVAFNNLPVAQLSRIAAEIENQEDYDASMIRHCLHRDDIKSIRARTFIRELVERKNAARLEDETPSIGLATKSRSGNAAQRVMDRLAQEAGPEVSEESDVYSESGSDSDIEAASSEESGMGIDGTGVLSTLTACVKEQDAMRTWASKTGAGLPKEVSVPSGWENTIKVMGAHEEIDNPHALAWWMNGKGYSPKQAQTPYGQGWDAENMVELANDIMSEMSNPQVMQLANKVVQDFANSQQMDMPQPGSKEFGELLAYGLQNDSGALNKIKKVMYESMMGETEEEMVSQDPSQAPEMSQQDPALVPATASKTAGIKDNTKDPAFNTWVSMDKTLKEAASEKKEESGQKEFNPEINDQQPAQVNHKPGDGLKVLKAYAIPSDHPLVDDNQDHYPVFTKEHAKATFIHLGMMAGKEAPSWWLGSTKELMGTVQAAFITAEKKEAGDLPPEFEENKKKKKDDKGKKDDDDGGNPFAKASERGFTAENVEAKLISGETVGFGSFALKMASTIKGQNILQLVTKSGNKVYQLMDMDSAISDFMYLAGTEKLITPPDPAFHIKEGIRLVCLGCRTINSYEMPEDASDLSCSGCSSVISARAVKSAFKNGGAQEETILVAFTPAALQEEFGDKFAKAAEILGADSVGAEGCRAEAYSVSTEEQRANAWDFLVEAGFKPLAQEVTSAPPAPPAGGMMAGEEEIVMDFEEVPIDDMPMDDMPMEDGVQDIGDEPQGSYAWADHQMVQAAMMHYQAQGKNVTEAIGEFNKDYGEGYDPEMIMQVAATVYSIGLDQVKIGILKDAGDLPSTTVNYQQPDSVSVGKGNAVIGPDSETNGEIKTPGKPKSQVKPQGTFSNTSTEPDSDNRDPGDFGAGKPKVHHPATDQQGVSLPDTNLGQHSDSQMGKMMRDMDSKSKAAPQSMQSK